MFAKLLTIFLITRHPSHSSQMVVATYSIVRVTLNNSIYDIKYISNIFSLSQMVMATYSIVRATLNSEEVDQQCVARCVLKLFYFQL